MTQALRILVVSLIAAGVASSGAAQEKRPLTLEDYPDWNRITEVELSPDGGWLAYAQQPNEGDAILFVRALDGDAVHETLNGRSAEFSSDGGWVGLLATPPEEEAEALREERKPVPNTLHVIGLSDGDRTEESRVRGFAFSETGRYLAIHKDRSDPESEHRGSDLLLRDLQEGTTLSFGNVSEYAFDVRGDFLAYVVDASGKSGNGLYVVSTADGRIRPLSTGPDRFEDLAWSEAAAAVTVLRGETGEAETHRSNSLVVATSIDGERARVRELGPQDLESFPTGFVISELAETRWTEDGSRILLGLKEQEPRVDDDEDDDVPNVDVWHWADDRLQSVQMVQADGDRRYTYAAAYDPDTGSFLRLATADMPRVDVPGRGRWAVGRRDAPYRGILTEDGGRADYVRIDLTSGEERLIASDVRRSMGTSPDGEWFLYVEDETVRATNLASLDVTDLSASAEVDFINQEFDRITEHPAYGIQGWTEDGRVLLASRWDVWSVPLSGGPAESLTGEAGSRDQIRFRTVDLDPESDWMDPEELTLSAYGEWTKQSGYFRARPGQDPEPLLFGDEMIRDLTKAEAADRVVFTRQTFEQFPDYWTSDLRLRDPRRVTDANPQIAEFAWGRRVLVDYVDQRGNELQATLALPAGYEEGQQYPMVVYFYEKMSQRHHEFSRPVYDDRPHMSAYASNGYLVLMPDIVYDDGYPGSSALDDVTAAAQKVIDLGYADPERIGLQGHSWGGYETSFILTQTDMFAAIVTGAPLTNLMSMNNILYKRTGNQNGPILQWSQGRMGDQPWDDFERWVSQSPVHQAPNIETPFLILHGTEDGAVDWNQGLELYTAARRLGKEVILLSYPGEPHHLAKESNQKDFQARMKQYFDHYLKGTEAPEWMTAGVPFLDKNKKTPQRRAIS